MLQLLKEKLLEVIKAFAPLIIVICILQFTLVRAPTALFLQFLIGSLMSMGGMVLSFMGIDIGILPMGRFIGAELPQRGSLLLIVGVAFSFGFATTIAEPDVFVRIPVTLQAGFRRVLGPRRRERGQRGHAHGDTEPGGDPFFFSVLGEQHDCLPAISRNFSGL